MSIARVAVVMLIAMVLGGCVTTVTETPNDKERFVIVFSPGPNWVKGKSIWEQPLREHAEYWHDLFVKKVMVLAGPYLDSSGGMAMIDVYSETEMLKIVKDDPAVKAGVLTAVAHPWLWVEWKNYGQ